jgi:hypothetical protein
MESLLKKKDTQEKQTNSLWNCRCADYICFCHTFYDSVGKEFCEDITKLLSEKYGFNYNEAIAFLKNE